MRFFDQMKQIIKLRQELIAAEHEATEYLHHAINSNKKLICEMEECCAALEAMEELVKYAPKDEAERIHTEYVAKIAKARSKFNKDSQDLHTA